MIKFVVNDTSTSVDVSPDTPLLWVLRDTLGLVGTKFGCGMAMCGACTVHLDGDAIRSCVTKVAEVADRRITTIEGLNGTHPLQDAWVEESVPQCGYCQPGQIMQAAALLKAKPLPTDDDINRAMAGNVCRCGTYPRIRRAIHRAAGQPVARRARRHLRVVDNQAIEVSESQRDETASIGPHARPDTKSSSSRSPGAATLALSATDIEGGAQ